MPRSDKQPIDGPLVIDGEPLELGMECRRSALHKVYGGSTQSGISSLGQYAAVFAFTGESGEQHGYEDSYQSNGLFRYYGEGQVGDMQLVRGNQAIAEHPKNQVRLFLFDTNASIRSFVVYKGEFEIVALCEDEGPDRNGDSRRRYFFDLKPLMGREPTHRTNVVQNQALFEEGQRREIVTNKVERNRAAVAKAKRIHGTSCQVCGFNFGVVYGQHGEGFIEAHHLHPVANAGKRMIDPEKDFRVVCSNCHRMLHKGGRLLDVQELKKIIELAG